MPYTQKQLYVLGKNHMLFYWMQIISGIRWVSQESRLLLNFSHWFTHSTSKKRNVIWVNYSASKPGLFQFMYSDLRRINLLSVWLLFCSWYPDKCYIFLLFDQRKCPLPEYCTCFGHHLHTKAPNVHTEYMFTFWSS